MEVSMGTAFQAMRIRRTWDRRLKCLKNSTRVDMPIYEAEGELERQGGARSVRDRHLEWRLQ